MGECYSPRNLAEAQDPALKYFDQDNDAIVSRGTSSPERRLQMYKGRRSPLKRDLANSKSRSNSNTMLQPIQLDSSLNGALVEEEEKIAKNAAEPATVDNDRRSALLMNSFNNDDVDYSDHEQAQH